MPQPFCCFYQINLPNLETSSFVPAIDNDNRCGVLAVNA